MTISVPPHTRLDLSSPKSPYCLVIPVFNEGVRLSNLLQDLQNLNRCYDVVIVDGGSTDDQIPDRDLQLAGVVSVLTLVEGPGLSSQLRAGYKFCLDAGYKGIITIDGNGKDDPKDIDKFVQQLESGIDFAQASRFIPGGVEINTPLSRVLAIRYIHAPVLSFFSGMKWTDTTQGFRGYSRRLVSSSELGIFRPIFKNYELLPYLNVRAPQLGFRCVEIPTSRIYPEGAVPTKITKFRGNLNILITLFRACLGKFNL